MVVVSRTTTSRCGSALSCTLTVTLPPSGTEYIPSSKLTVTGGSSSSSTVTARPSRVAPKYSDALLEATAWVTVWASSTASVSWAAVTITVWAVFQVALVKVSEEGLTLTSPPPVMSTVTSAVGWALSSTV